MDLPDNRIYPPSRRSDEQHAPSVAVNVKTAHEHRRRRQSTTRALHANVQVRPCEKIKIAGHLLVTRCVCSRCLDSSSLFFFFFFPRYLFPRGSIFSCSLSLCLSSPFRCGADVSYTRTTRTLTRRFYVGRAFHTRDTHELSLVSVTFRRRLFQQARRQSERRRGFFLFPLPLLDSPLNIFFLPRR